MITQRFLRGAEPPRDGEPAERRARGRDRLDELVSNMELTLISIIQGVALYFLTETARTIIVDARLIFWPYIAVGLITILLFWSRSLIHTFTVIRWPLEFGHNFLYIACTLLEAVMFTQIASIERWYLFGAIYGSAVWILFAFDLRMIRQRRAECAGGEGEELCDRLERDQLLNVRLLLPAFVVYHVLALLAIGHWPDIFIARSWHLLFGAGQLLGGLFYVGYVLRLFSRLSPLIIGRRDLARG
jgi:hypothetical protein